MDDIGRNFLNRLRDEYGATGAARRIGVSRQTLCNWLSGRSEPTAENRQQISAAMDGLINDLAEQIMAG